MNRRIASLVAMAAITFSSGATAQAFASAAGGKGKIALECAGLASCDESSDAYRFTAGYRFPGGISAELGISDFGSARQTSLGMTTTATVTAVTFGAAIDAPLGRWAGLMSRVGVARLKTEVTGFGFSRDDANTAPYVGVGFYIAPWRNIRIEFGFDRSRAELNGDKADVGAVLLGVRVLF